ncbi:hypothetical protein Vadar_021015 [Vaccinium darrowii]|uniref:Uncharacterized protein n=1 Tax=Vaccinium darrowii TaxID=229202 RepID=A0ACB7ZFA3_9ERIC|nr:hypothetical protein Vadar_021015 [Vaccinium darrowii]
MFEEKAQRISEAATALRDDEENAWDNVYSTRHTIQEILNEETFAKEGVQKATITLSLAEVNLHMPMELFETVEASSEGDSKHERGGEDMSIRGKEEEALLSAQDEVKECRATLGKSVVAGILARFIAGQPGPAVIIGNGLALSSTVVVLQIIAQLLSERLIPLVALDVRRSKVFSTGSSPKPTGFTRSPPTTAGQPPTSSDELRRAPPPSGLRCPPANPVRAPASSDSLRTSSVVGRGLDLPVYFGDSGSREVLHKVGAERACAAAITLDTSGANYRTVWALSKYFPNVKTFVRAHDGDHGLNLEKAGATAVHSVTIFIIFSLSFSQLHTAPVYVPGGCKPDCLCPCHLSELTELCEISGSSLGYGYARVMTKPKSQPSDSSDENQITEGTLAV